MAYSMNPYLPKVRAQAVRQLRERDESIHVAARRFGVAPSTICRWLARAPRFGSVSAIPTLSSRPRSCPHATPGSIVERIRALRLARGRCAEVIHAMLTREGTTVSLSTVKRVLAREGLVRRHAPNKVWHQSGERPVVAKAGDLVEMDSIHLWIAPKATHFILTLLDCFSRWAYARALPRITCETSARAVFAAQQLVSFRFATIQSDHGTEFSTYFTERVQKAGMRHRHIRVRQPNDNAHIERFNRTIQDELSEDINRFRDDLPRLNEAIQRYLVYYNEQRPHLGLGCRTPSEVLRRS